MRKIYLSGIVLSILLSGCGGGGGAANTTPPPNTGTQPTPPPEAGNPPPGNETVKLIDSFTGTTEWQPYFNDIAGLNGYLYNLANCDLGSSTYKVSIKIYTDATAESSFNTNKYQYNDTCLVTRVFSQQKPSDGKIEANYINGYTFYDKNSKTYYDVDYFSNDYTTLISISNDGMTVVAQNKTGTTQNAKLIRAYKEIYLTEAGITPKFPPFFSTGNPGDIMEYGLAEDVTSPYKPPYNFVGNLYLYKTEGVSKDWRYPTTYKIFNDRQIEMKNANEANVQRGYITEVFERIKPIDQKAINAQYLSPSTFYDSKSKVFFELDYQGFGTDMIVDITNDGNSAVLRDGRISKIVKSYKKVL